MTEVAAGTQIIDVEYLGKSQYIACCLLEGDKPALIDPGPSISLGKVEEGLGRAGLSIDDLSAVLLTHIHLDHAGAAGTIIKRNPRAMVYVHVRGAAHMADPSRLLDSAHRIYGDEMESLWGDFLAVPADNIRSVSGGETLELGGRRLEVAYTPGHASHHVSYLDTSTGTAYVGDTTGIRISNNPLVLPVTPAPDIDLDRWESSLQKIEAWNPERLFVTHFGAADRPDEHVEKFRRHLADWAAVVKEGLTVEGSDEQRCNTFTDRVQSLLDDQLPENMIALYRQGGAPAMSWHGLARYWRKHRTEA